ASLRLRHNLLRDRDDVSVPGAELAELGREEHGQVVADAHFGKAFHRQDLDAHVTSPNATRASDSALASSVMIVFVTATRTPSSSPTRPAMSRSTSSRTHAPSSPR